MSAHDDTIDLSPFKERENLINGRSRPDHDSALNPKIPGALGEVLKAASRGSSFGVGAGPRFRTRTCG